MIQSRDYEFEATKICAEIIFECAVDDASVMAAIEAGLNAAQAIVPIEDTCELSILICDDETITELNAEWRGKAYATNVLSFPSPLMGDGAPIVAGEGGLVETSPSSGASAFAKASADKSRHLLPSREKEFLVFLGDMAISLPTTQREAVEMGIPLTHHLTHLAIHSLFHLLGYDHETESDAAIMEALEIRAMAHLGLPNPYEGDRCRPII